MTIFSMRMMACSGVLVVMCSLVVPASGQYGAPASKAAAPATALQPARTIISAATVIQDAAKGSESTEAGQDAASATPAEGTPAEATTAEAKAKQAEQEAKAKQAARLQKIKKLTFDRRPAAILAEWLSVEAEKHAKPKEDEEEEAAAAAGETDAGTADTTGQDTSPFGSSPFGSSEAASEEEAASTEAAATEAAATEAAEGAAEKAEPDPFDAELKAFQRAVTLGDWQSVKEFLHSLEDAESKAAYEKLLVSLQGAPKGLPPGLPKQYESQIAAMVQAQTSRTDPRARHRHVISFDDVLGLAAAAPHELDDAAIGRLGAILSLALQDGNTLESFVTRLRSEVAMKKGRGLFDRRGAALLLMAANESVAAGEFLPTLEEAKEQKDHQGLNLLSRHHLALYAKDKKAEHLNQAWLVTQAVFSLGDVEGEDRDEALKRAVELAPKVREELGQVWLEESFTAEPQRGMEIVAAIGTAAAIGLQKRPTDSAFRKKSIELQTTAVEALLSSAPERADAWRAMLDLLASNWLREAALSLQLDQSSGRGPMMQRDQYGNIFYLNQGMNRGTSSTRVSPIKSADLLENKPSAAWMQRVRASMRPKFDMVFAELHLKVNEEDAAFPYIEKLAQQHPENAEELVKKFLSVWTQNHDPNASRNRTSSYMFMYGYERRAESIPLTRSKQERNLRELAGWVARLKKLPLKKIDEKLLARAFTTCHSSAEVYQMAAIESVFGDVEQLAPETLAELAQQMRANLMGVWRAPATQENKKTKRKQKDIQTEVVRGYQTARDVVETCLKKHPEEWTLQLALASLNHDENNYKRDLAKSSGYTENRLKAFAEFEEAAKLYAKQLPSMSEDDVTAKVFEIWYYASLGACDLQHVREDSVSDLEQPELIRKAIEGLPKPYAEKHVEMFANSLFTRMSAVNPAVKFRYLKHGFAITGDHKRTLEARKIFDYYNDLVTEIKLRVALDGDDAVGHEKPFGVFVNLVHTREIERESGGFARYLQNQNTGTQYFYNYGRPTENYRDKFEEIVQQSLSEQFEILSVTFQAEDVNSKSLPELGWRVTPYAYLLLKARGPEVDKLAPVRLDLDFLDTSGYVIIPVESQSLPIDAGATDVAARPVSDLTVTQTLDERQAAEGKLVLEIKASGQGLVPDLEVLLKLEPTEFDVTDTEDEGVSVSQFDSESDETVVISERSWLVSMQAKDNLAELPKSFQFADVQLPTKEVVYQRYVDADLLAVKSEVSLEQEYGSTSYAWIYWIGLIVLLVAVAIAVLVVVTRRPAEAQAKRFHLPEPVTPFTVIGLLRNIESNNGLDDSGRRELQESISQLEKSYFAEDAQGQPDLETLARQWVQRSC